MSESFQFIGPPPNPGATATAILWDSTYMLLGTPILNTPGPYRRMPTGWKRATVTVFADQIVTVSARTLMAGSTTWRTYNGTGAGEATAVNTLWERDILLIGDDQQIIITTTTIPGVWEVSIKMRDDAGLAQ